MSVQAILATFVDELALVLGALVEARAHVSGGSVPADRAWDVTLTSGGENPGACVITVGHDGLEGICRALSDDADREVADADVEDLLRQSIAQAAAVVAARPVSQRLELTIASIHPSTGRAFNGTPFSIAITGLALPLELCVAFTPAAAATRTDIAAEADERIEDRIDVILDIDLPVVVRFGHADLPIKVLSKLGPGSVIELGRSPDDPVELLVSDRVIAHGEVVVVGGNYGIRILDVASPSERVRSLEA